MAGRDRRRSLVLLAAGLLAGCGGSDERGAGTASSPAPRVTTPSTTCWRNSSPPVSRRSASATRPGSIRPSATGPSTYSC